MRPPWDFRAYLSHRRAFPPRVDRQPLDRPRGPDTGRREGRVELAERATEPWSELGRVDDCCDRDGKGGGDAAQLDGCRCRGAEQITKRAHRSLGRANCILEPVQVAGDQAVAGIEVVCGEDVGPLPLPASSIRLAVATNGIDAPTEVGGPACWIGGGG